MLKKIPASTIIVCLAVIFISFFLTNCSTVEKKKITKEHDKYDGIEQAMLFEIERTKDPALGRVPSHKMWEAIQQTEQTKDFLRNHPTAVQALSWQERGPNGDFTIGGNPRPSGQQTSGRIRAAMIDSTDPTHKTVWVGGVDGGLWKTTDITVSPSPWTLINDYMSNLAIAAICQDPRPGFQNIMYVATGESFRNADAVRGVGVFKSIDGGATWNFLSSTSAHILCTRIVCDFQGNVYLATRNAAGAPGGLYRSTDGGTSWTNITPTGVPSQSICDLEISSTSGPARLHMTTGIGNAQTYRYTDIPATVTPGSGWNAPITPFPGLNDRCELAVMGNTLYALPVDGSSQVPVIYKTTDGGANWAATAAQPPSGWASGQGWYSLSCGINPANPDECIVGGLDCYKTSNGGTSWVKISSWATSTTGFYVHADQHNIQWWDGGTKLLYACDGGIHYSTNGGITNSDRNKGLRLKQFYSVAISPVQTNYFIGGTQDNGMHRMNHPGLDSSAEVVGGDGCYSAIDQNEPQFQFGSYVYNVYRRSTNAGATWSTPVNNQSSGRFVNPWDYDNNTNIIYACNNAGTYLRWDNPQTGSTTNVISVPAFGTGNVSAVHCSPYTAHRVFFGTGSSTLFRVDEANTATPSATAITPTGATGYLNCVVTGSSDNNLIATYSSYGVTNVWVSTNGGATWTACDGNLPDMPVRWALFHPDTDGKAFIATETGVWETDNLNGASTVWVPNTTFPTVRTDMLKYRSSDRTIAAGTHGRGIWTATIPAASGFAFNPPAAAVTTCPAPSTMSVNLTTSGSGGFINPITLSAIAGVPGGTNITFSTNPVTPGGSTNVFLNNANILSPGTYNVTIQGVATGATTQTVVVTYTINPGSGPVITTQPTNQTVCAGSNASFTVASATATGFQWQVSTDGGTNWSNIGGATSTTLTLTGVTAGMNGNQYRCVATALCGSTNSNAATLTVNTAATITANPNDATICAGQTTQLCVTASGTGITYQWQSSSNCAGSWTNISGATTNCYNANPASTTSYRCVVSASGACSGSVNSNCATVTVVSSVTVTTQPNSQAVCEGGNVSFMAAGNGGSLTYQWQLSTDGGANYNNITGATNATYTVTGVTAAMDNNRYRCVISNGICPTPGITNAATLTVNRLAAINTQPNDATICSGSNNTFCVTATGTALSYQWQSAPNCSGPWTNITGGTSPCLTVTGTSTANYRCNVTSGACSNTVTSNCVTLTVINPATVTSQPAAVAVCSGSNASFSVTGSSAQTIIYQWQLSTDGGTTWTNITGANTATLTLNNTTVSMNNNRYRCQLSNATCSTPAVSNSATLTVRQLPTVGLSAAPLTSLLPGKTTTLTATPSASTGGTLSTQWFYNNNPLAVSGNTYIANVEKTGSYRVTIQEAWPGGLVCSNQSPTVTIDAAASPKLFIFPSPNDGRYTVSYYNSSGSATQQQIVVFDAKGAAVYSRKFNITGPYTLLNIDMQGANTGIYIVVVGDASGKKLAEGKVHIK
jgi:hypothetical protein